MVGREGREEGREGGREGREGWGSHVSCMVSNSDQMCRDVNDEDLALGESSYLYQDNQDRCRVFTCQVC